MLHFPSPVKLTGWNATGGLLGRKDESFFFFFPSPALLSSSPSPTTSCSLTLLLPLVSLCCFHASCMCVSVWLDSYVMRHHSLWCVDVLVLCPGLSGLCWPMDVASVPPDSHPTLWSSLWPCHPTALNYLITPMSSLQAPTWAVCNIK